MLTVAIIGSRFNEKITFHQVKFKGTSFELIFNKDDFSGNDIKVWRGINKGRFGTYSFSDFNFESYNYAIIKEKAQILKKSIVSAVGENGKVKIYPLVRPKTLEGYQFLLSLGKFDKLIPTERLQLSGKKDARCFNIDLQDTDLQLKLEHIVKLAHSFVIPGVGASYPRDFLFIIAKADLGGKAIYEYDKMIGAFDRNRFYTPDEIYSTDQVEGEYYKPVRIANFENGIRIDSYLIDQWARVNKFLVMPTKYSFPKNYITWW